jgi:hypothetical protein
VTIGEYLRVGKNIVRGKQLRLHIMSLAQIMSAVSGSLLHIMSLAQIMSAVSGSLLHIMSLAQIMSAVSGSLLQTSTRTQRILEVPCTVAGVYVIHGC